MTELFSASARDWFRARVGEPTAVQREGWPHIAAGENVLISAPTGTGKTLTAFLLFLDRLKAEAAQGTLADEVRVLYVSPLKSLAGDIRENLQRPNEGIPGPVLRTGLRTGDTTPADRAKMLRKPPHILLTTPESLYLLLTAPRSRAMLRAVQAVIVDELHALIGSKRGAHLMLSLARLDDLCGRRVQRIGLSATIRPLERAAQFLAHPAPCAVVAPALRKEADILVTSPLPDLRLVQGTVWTDLCRRTYELCQGARTVLAFVEGRQQAERLAHGVNQLAGAGFARTHHGCVSREQRLEAEQQLREGKLRLLCATSSMELGIDVGQVDLVVQIGCPRTVSGALQRMGRAGHRPGAVSVMRVFCKTAADALACGLTARAAQEGEIEPAEPPENCLDVLAQHLVSMAVQDEYTVDDALRILHGCWTYRDAAREDVCACLKMLAGDYEHEQDRPVRPRVLYDRLHGRVRGDAYTSMLAYSASGTIPDRGWYQAVLPDGTRLGELDEEFVYEARVGDKFLLGAFAWKIVEIGRDRVVVAQTSAEGAQPPFWRGDGTGRAYPVALRFGSYLERVERAAGAGGLGPALRSLGMDADAAANAARHVRAQIEATGALPTHRRIVCEHFSDEMGKHQLMVHSIFGRRVNFALSLLCRRAAERLTGQDVLAFEDDDGFLLYAVGGEALPEGLLQGLDARGAAERVCALLPGTPLFSMNFRYACACALMMGVRGGRRQPLWVQRMRGEEQLSALAQQAEHPLIREALRACERDNLDLDALRDVLAGIASGAIEVQEMHAAAPSPMALPMRRAVEAKLLYEYDNVPSAAVRTAERAVQALGGQDGVEPDEAALAAQYARRRLPENPDQLHSLLLAEGDLAPGELDVPEEWLRRLQDQGRACYVAPGLWIAAESEALYAAVRAGDPDALCRAARRCLRYRGEQDAQRLAQRYGVPEEAAGRALESLRSQGIALLHGEGYAHREVFSRAQQETLRMRRAAVETVPGERFAALLAASLRTAGSQEAQLRAALDGLLGQFHPLAAWEGSLLPARVANYRPALLDGLLAAGEYSWTLRGGEAAFFRAQDVDWDAEPEAPEGFAPAEDESRLLDALRRRGASFSSALSALLGGRSALEPLLRLAQAGLVRADSFAPLRALPEVLQPGRAPGKRLARLRSGALSAGRWELARPERALSADERLERAFSACPILSRETVTGLPWAEAADLLRHWEYTGRARRGYFVQGLSGMQFVRAQDCARVRHALDHPGAAALWLPAQDPGQAYGRALAHAAGREFTRAAGTAVCLLEGRAVAVLERQGEALRLLEPACADEALTALARDFAARRILPHLDRLCIRAYPEGAASALARAGFARLMLDYVLYP